MILETGRAIKNELTVVKYKHLKKNPSGAWNEIHSDQNTVTAEQIYDICLLTRSISFFFS